jgi:hypothetical protein
MQSDEKRFEDAFAAAFERLPEPDPSRLKLLEERLGRATTRIPRRPRPRWTYWWLILGLVATGAAAWWGGEYLRRAPQTPVVKHEERAFDSPSSEVQEGTRAETNRADEAQTGEGVSRQREIYRREQY